MSYSTQASEVFIGGDSQGYHAVPENYLDFDENGDVHLPEGAELPEGFIYLDPDYDDAYRLLALGLHLDDMDSVEAEAVHGSEISLGNHTYLVMTDEEADRAWDQELEHFLDECVIHEIPEPYQRFFDREAWKEEARYDGRGHALASYDGNEYDVDTNNGTYYIFRAS